MLNIGQATKIVEKTLPNGEIQSHIEYKDLYLFKVFDSDPLEGKLDPFFSVNKETGEFKEFSILTDGDIYEVTRLFVAVEGGES